MTLNRREINFGDESFTRTNSIFFIYDFFAIFKNVLIL